MDTITSPFNRFELPRARFALILIATAGLVSLACGPATTQTTTPAAPSGTAAQPTDGEASGGVTDMPSSPSSETDAPGATTQPGETAEPGMTDGPSGSPDGSVDPGSPASPGSSPDASPGASPSASPGGSPEAPPESEAASVALVSLAGTVTALAGGTCELTSGTGAPIAPGEPFESALLTIDFAPPETDAETTVPLSVQTILQQRATDLAPDGTAASGLPFVVNPLGTDILTLPGDEAAADASVLSGTISPDGLGGVILVNTSTGEVATITFACTANSAEQPVAAPTTAPASPATTPSGSPEASPSSTP